MNNEVIFVSPHSKKIGETYVLPRLLRKNDAAGDSALFRLFNVCGEWDDQYEEFGDRIIQNRCRWITRLSPDIENLSPWWNYRIWLFFVSISIAVGLPLSLGARSNATVVMRMATSGGAIAAWFAPKLRFVASMAGVPHETFLRRFSWPLLYRSYARIVVPCESMKEAVAKISGKDIKTVEIIRNAVLEDDTSGKQFFINKFDDETLRIVMVGRLTRQKGVDTAINAIAKLDFPVQLTLVGEGEDLEALQKLVDGLGVAGSVEFTGYDPKPETEMLNHDLFIMPSRWEGPGHSIIEALSIRMPSAVSNCPYGPEETVGYGAYGGVFEVDDYLSLANEITNVYANYGDYVEKAALGEKVCDQYRASAVAESWKQFLEKFQ